MDKIIVYGSFVSQYFPCNTLGEGLSEVLPVLKYVGEQMLTWLVGS